MAAEITVEGATLEACRSAAARRLGLAPEGVAIQILQHGKEGLFSSRPFRVRAGPARPAPAGPAGDGGSFLSKLDVHVRVATAGMERLDLLRDGNENRVFNELLAAYEKLPDERRQEIIELSKLMSGPGAKKIQERIAKDGFFRLRVSPDRMTALMDVAPPEGVGRAVSVHDVLQRLRDEGVTYGLDNVIIRKILAEVVELGRPISGVQVARGLPAEAGAPGRVEFLVDLAAREQVLRQDGSVDHHGKARITVVRRGQPLARLVPPVPGKPGANVRGERLEPPPSPPAKLAVADNVAFVPEENEYRAAIDGIVELGADGLRVRQTFVVSGDVDMSTGNVEFNGTVRVAGSVRDGFSVRASGDIDIQGGVEGCEIVSEKGAVKIRQGVAGRHRCFISAGRDVEAKYIENARVYARNDVRVDVAIMHSEVVAGNAVLAVKGKGAIIGGMTKAGSLVHARTLGAPNEPVTEFLVGISIEEQDQIRDMDQRAVALGNVGERIAQVVREFEHAARDLSRLPARDKQHYLDLRKKLLVLHYEMDRIAARRKEFVARIAAQNRGAVKVSSEVYGRVVVRIGQFVEPVAELVHAIAFRPDAEQGHIVRDRYAS